MVQGEVFAMSSLGCAIGQLDIPSEVSTFRFLRGGASVFGGLVVVVVVAALVVVVVIVGVGVEFVRVVVVVRVLGLGWKSCDRCKYSSLILHLVNEFLGISSVASVASSTFSIFLLPARELTYGIISTW